jgi:hypothetical protein
MYEVVEAPDLVQRSRPRGRCKVHFEQQFLEMRRRTVRREHVYIAKWEAGLGSYF